MISSMNAYGGLSATLLLKLFEANPASPPSNTPSSAQPTSAFEAGANDPASTIKAILAQAQIGSIGAAAGGWSITETAEAAYASQMGESSSNMSASLTVSAPGVLQQIDQAVAELNQAGMFDQIDSVHSVGFTVTTNDAVAVNLSNGVASATAMQGATFPNGLPSLDTIQQAFRRCGRIGGSGDF